MLCLPEADRHSLSFLERRSAMARLASQIKMGYCYETGVVKSKMLCDSYSNKW